MLMTEPHTPYRDRTFYDSFPQWILIDSKQYARTFRHVRLDRIAEVYAEGHTVLITDSKRSFCQPATYCEFENYRR